MWDGLRRSDLESMFHFFCIDNSSQDLHLYPVEWNFCSTSKIKFVNINAMILIIKSYENYLFGLQPLKSPEYIGSAFFKDSSNSFVFSHENIQIKYSTHAFYYNMKSAN
jgi:hypothetical protein